MSRGPIWTRSSTFTATRHDRSRSLGPGSRVLPGTSRGSASAFLLPKQNRAPEEPEGRLAPSQRRTANQPSLVLSGGPPTMIIVMSMGATEQETNNVRDQLRQYDLTPHDNYGAQRVVIAVLGDVAPVRDLLMSKLSVMPGVESVTPITRPYKLTSRESHPEDTVIEVLGTQGRRRQPDHHGRAVLDRRPRHDDRDGPVRGEGRGHNPARAARSSRGQPVRIPGSRRRGVDLPGRGQQGHGPADHHRGHGAEPGRGRGQALGHPAGRHPEHAELLPPERSRQGGPARSCSSAATAPRSKSG